MFATTRLRLGTRWCSVRPLSRCAYGAAGVACAAVVTAWSWRRGEQQTVPNVVYAATVPIAGSGGKSGTPGGVGKNTSVDDDGLCSLIFDTPSPDIIASALNNSARQSYINVVGASGATPLMLAAYLGNVDVVRVLLDNGADTEVDTKLTRSYTHWNRYFDPYKPFGKGFRAFDFAVLGGHPDTIALLIERGRMDPTIPRPVVDAKKGRTVRGPDGRPITQSEDLPDNVISPEVLVERCHRVVRAANLDAAEQEKALLLAAVKRGRALREDRLRRHRSQFPLEARLEEQLVGQLPAIQAVSSAVRRKENGWVDEDSPLVMLFMGSSGIGKTKTAKLIGEYIHGGEDKEKLSQCFIRIDMSEFQHKHEVSKFIGAPPGYIGYESGGQLVSKLEKCPNAVVLLDEVEKAHPDVLTVMLQAFDEGRLTDGQGKTVNCADAIFVLTSNLAQQEIADEAVRLRRASRSTAAQRDETDTDVREVSLDGSVDPLTKNFKRNVVQPILRRHFGRDEFLGRINEILFFLPFTDEEQRQLAHKELEAWRRRAATKLNIDLTWSPDVEAVAAEEYDLRYGARSIKYEVDRMCIAPIARAQEEGVVKPGCRLHIDVDWRVVEQTRRAAAQGDASREQEEKEHIKENLLAQLTPRLPAAFGGKGDDLAKKRETLIAAMEKKGKGLSASDTRDAADQQAGGKVVSSNKGGAAAPAGTDENLPLPPKALPGMTLYRSGKVALHVGEKDPANGGGGGGLKRFFSFGGSS
jgi:ATP-dependent Clp protease ATP-binding subunit ClpB